MATDDQGFHYADSNPARDKEKKELLAMDDMQAMSLSAEMYYQRNRYLREIEGMEFVRKEQSQSRTARERKNYAEPGQKAIGSKTPNKDWNRGLDKD